MKQAHKNTLSLIVIVNIIIIIIILIIIIIIIVYRWLFLGHPVVAPSWQWSSNDHLSPIHAPVNLLGSLVTPGIRVCESKRRTLKSCFYIIVSTWAPKIGVWEWFQWYTVSCLEKTTFASLDQRALCPLPLGYSGCNKPEKMTSIFSILAFLQQDTKT